MTRRALLATFGLAWIALLVMRVIMNWAGSPAPPTIPQLLRVVGPITAFWIPLIGAVLWINRRPGARASGVAAHVFAAAAVVLVEPTVAIAVLSTVGIDRPYAALLVGRLDTNVLIYALIVVADVVITRVAAFRARELAAARLEQALADAQLHALAIQLQPHFLFNALQFVAETAHDDLQAARRTLTHLRGLVHQAFSLEHRVEVSLAEELSFLESYGEIQRSRFGDRFELTIEADPEVLGAAIPPLLLQPLVENAARHGFGSRGAGGSVVVRGRTEGDSIVLTVADDGAGLTRPSRDGQGLSVTRRRLERLHGKAASLALVREGNHTVARLRFPLRRAGPLTTNPAHTVAETAHVSVHDRVGPQLPLAMRLIAFWSVLMALVIGATAAGAAFAPALPGSVLQRVLADEVVGFPFWLAMTVVAVVAGRHLRGPVAVPAHLAIGLTLAMAHVSLGPGVARVVLGEASPPDAYGQWATWDVLVYIALVLLARSHDLREWLRAKAREEVTLNERVVAANERLARLREMQGVLLASLDDVIASPTMESLDHAVVEFGDFLRGHVMPDVVGVAAGAGA